MILFVGLGNPTQAYQNTRHNFGFMVLDEFLKNHKTTLIDKSKFKGLLYKSDNFLALKPQTYMNLSGQSVEAVKNFYKIERVVVLHDDLDIPLGSIRFKIGGSSGGHNGLKSIDAHIGSEYERVRLGIGKPMFKSQVVDFVLQDFTPDESECMQKVLLHVSTAMEKLISESLHEVNAKFTSKKGIC